MYERVGPSMLPLAALALALP
ncbi:MAG: hypothetical protein K0S48_2298, partial [Ramlibacter sp.]|nr:hypothetical protein [Ramlibacter sp.]